MIHEFADKDMIEQITMLDELKESGQTGAVPALMELYATPLVDRVVDEMVYHTLYDLMAGDPELMIAGMQNSSKRVQLVSIRRAADGGNAQVQATLVDLLSSCVENEIISEIIRVLGCMGDSSLSQVLLPFLEHADIVVSAWTMESLVKLNSEAGRAALEKLVAFGAEAASQCGECDLKTAQAIGCVAKYKDAQAADFLVTYIHHLVASFRRVVVSDLVSMGVVVLPAMEKCLTEGDKDEKIMAANIVGWIGHKKGADLLVTFLDQAKDLDTNLRFAIYEGLGRLPSLRSLIGLSDGLKETAEMVLIAVVTGMNDLCNPGVVKTMTALFDKGDAQSQRILQVIVTARAAKLFAAIYSAGTHAETMINAILASGDNDAILFFRAELEKMASESALADAKKMIAGAMVDVRHKVVVADDSKAMLFFYKGASAEMNLDLTTAADGRLALAIMQEASDIDLLVTDMNMPNMDGIELTKEIRKMPQWANLPILMATTESEASQVELARAAGVNGFLTKPFTKDVFLEKVKSILQ